MKTMTRREFLKVSGLVAAGGVTGATGLLGLRDESGTPVIDQVPIPIQDLPAGLDGFTIVQLSDIHMYPFTQPETVQRGVELANSLNPGVVVLTGDFVWQELEAIHELAPILAGLNARHGVYVTLGNHDYWTDITVIKEAFAKAGLPVLVNQGVPIREGNASLWLAGLDDGWSGRPDLDQTLEGMTSNMPVVLLCHEPDLADVYCQDERIDFQISGHTHAGQIRILGMGSLVHPYLGKKYEMGLYDVNGMWLYTNRGLGCISEPVRYNCPPEVSEFTLLRG